MPVDPSSYQPKLIDTSRVEISEEMRTLIEVLAENAHDLWARDRIAGGWRWGPDRNDSLKLHPCLVRYNELPESEKNVDRSVVLGTLKAILASGYRIEKV